MGNRAGGGSRGGGGGAWWEKSTKQAIETIRKNRGSIHGVSEIGEAYQAGQPTRYDVTVFYGNKQNVTLISTNKAHVAGWRKEIKKQIKANNAK